MSDPDHQATPYRHRIAVAADIPAIMALMGAAIEHNMRPFLSPAGIVAARETMGVDRTLVDDGTYFLVHADTAAGAVLVGCGGWGRRRTLYGGDHTVGRDDSLADPATDAARIRAMYTHPDWTRRGIGTLLLELGEAAARAAGFATIELGSTLAGEPLYRARGYVEIGRETHRAANGADNVVIHMRKSLVDG
ncbi:MAG: GNAT family N-acetyltransferase [Pseudomonadales bacterium]|jgi:GNAT superfamily N-acetyltransferase|nr:GNAT family N-acetyltransferase [Pseudomonadales bacterium]